MKNIRFLLILALGLAGALLSASLPAQRTRSAETLLGAALHQEEVEGNLEAAIETYKKILADFSRNRPAVARALLHMGQCYERLGKDEARKAYERLVREYGDQAEQANLARNRLAALSGPSPTTLTTRKLENPPPDAPMAAVSPDGKFIAFANWQGNLVARDLQTGVDRRLTNEATTGNIGAQVVQGAWNSAWLPDGKHIVYAWYIKSDTERLELRSIGLDGGKPRILSQFNRLTRLASFTSSPDSRQIAATVLSEDGRSQLALISAADGSIRILADLEREIYPTTVLFSPDGRYLAYDRLPDHTSPERDIFLTSIESGQATPLIQHPADDYLLGWSRDGKWIIFASDRTGALGLWAMGMSGAKTQGAPQLIKSGIDRILPVGLTREGGLYYGVVKATEDVYIVDLDLQAGKVAGSPRKAIEQFEGGNFSPAYSHDGKYLAYVSRRGNSPYPTNVGNALCIRSLATGQERIFYKEIWRLGLQNIDGPTWSPDGRSVAFAAMEVRGTRRGAYRIDLETGAITCIFRCSPDEGFPGILYGPDGNYAFARGNRKQNISQIVLRSIESGAERELYGFPMLDRYTDIAFSKDGRWLSFVNAGWGAVRSMRVMPALGGDAREIWNFGETKSGVPNVSHTWTPDGRYILFSAPDPGDLPSWDLWRMPVEGGKPQKMGLQKRWGLWSLAIHPDGRQLAFAGRGGPSSDSELWVMESFLPPAGNSK